MASRKPPAVAGLGTANLAVKFALEIAAVIAFAYWGATVGTGVIAVVLAIASPLVAVSLWARLAAPRAMRRLPLHLRAPFELAVFGLAALALLSVSSIAAIVFTSAVVVNSLLLTVLGQWDA